jgi:hypothetical protein
VQLLLKLAVIGAVMGIAIYKGDGMAIALTAVLLAPVAAVLFTNDVMGLLGGSAHALRKHAYDSDMRVFKYGYSTQIRMIMHRNRAWFEARPVCEALEHRDVERAIRYYATTEHCIYGVKKEKFLSESAVRRLAEISRSAEAPSFQRWFDNEVGATLERTRRRMKSTAAIDVDLTQAPPPESADRPAP